MKEVKHTPGPWTIDDVLNKIPEVNEGTISYADRAITNALKDSIEKETNGFIYKTDSIEEKFVYLSEAETSAEHLSQSYAYVEIILSKGDYWVATGKPSARSWERVLRIFRNGYEFNVTTGKQL